MQMQGAVTHVISEPQGGIVLSWVDNVMTVQNAADFSREGGTFTTDGGTSLYDFVQVTEGEADEDPDLVFTSLPAPATWPSEEAPVEIWPSAVDMTAEVTTDDGDTIPATVPHALRTVLAEGVRDVEDMERVLIEQRGTEWVVVDIIGRRAMVQPDHVEGLDENLADLRSRLDQSAEALDAAQLDLEQRAQANADAIAAARTELAAADQVMAGQINAAKTAAATAQATADKATSDAAALAGKSKVLAQTTAPTDKTVLWIDTTGGANTPKVWTGAAWTAVDDADIVAASQAAMKAQADAAAAKAAADAAMAAASKTAVDLATAEAALKAMDQQLKTQQDQTKADLTQAQQDLNAADLTIQRAADAAAAAAKAADEKAGRAQTSANGKNTIIPSTSAPTSGTPGTAIGDLWMQHAAGGVIIGMWTWTALGWVPRPVDSQAIANLDVGKLTAGSASISNVVATKLAADFGAYRVLTADKVVIASGDNLLIDPLFRDSKAWNQPQWINPSSGKTGTGGTLVIPASSVQRGCYATLTQQWMATIQPGAAYRVGGWVKTSVDAPPGSLVIFLREYGVEGTSFTWASPSTRSNPTTVPAGVWTWVGGTFEADATGVRAAVGFFSQPTFSGEAVWSDAEFRPMGTGELLVDGAVTARALAAEAVTAGKIAANAVTAGTIAANAVTADKVLANEAYARIIGGLLADFKQVFANKITADMLVADRVLAGKVAALVGDFADLFATKITASMLNVDEALAQKLQAVIATFQSVFAGTIVADMIQLDTLAGKVLNGVDIYSPHVDSFPQVHIGGSVIETKRQVVEEDGVKRAVTGISLGGDTADKMQLLNPDGSVLAGFDADGSGRSNNFAAQGDITATGEVTADAGDFGVLSVGPYPDLAGALNNQPRGVIARQKLGSSALGNGVRFGSTYLGYYELFFAPGDQLTKVTYTGQINADGPGYYAVKLVATSHPNPDVIPDSPSITQGNYTNIAFCGFQASSKGLYPIYLEGWVPPYAGSYRVALLASVPTGGPSGYVWSTDNEPSWLVAENVGTYAGQSDGGYNRAGGTVYAGSPTPTESTPVVVKKTYTSTWNASGVATYRAGVGSMSTSQYLLQQGTYGGKDRWSHVVFNGGAVSGEKGKTVAQALSGATVSKVEFYGLVRETYWGSSGTAVLAPATQTALTSIATSSAESRFGQWKAGTAKWVTLYNPLGNQVRSVAIGPDSSGSVEYIKFDPTLAKLKLRVTYIR